MNKLYQIFKKIISPKFCLYCFKSENSYLCNQCIKKLNFKPYLYCFECEQKIHKKCIFKNHSRLIKALISFGDYENKFLKDLILKGKEGYKEIFEDLAEFISCKIKIPKNFDITFVPLTKKRLLQRGFNQNEIIAKTLKKKFNIKIYQGLVKIKETKDQSSISYKERIENIKGAFALTEKPPQNIIIIDDIKTSGATLKECAKILKEKGSKQIIALTILK